MEEQPTNTFPTLREVQEIEKAHEGFWEALQDHVFSAPKPYVEEEEIAEDLNLTELPYASNKDCCTIL